MRIAVIGASANRDNFGNKCVRAYLSAGHKVFPVNPKEKTIEGLVCYKSISEIKERIDAVSLYLLPSAGKDVVDNIISKKPEIVYMNPGTEDEDIEEKLKKNSIKAIKQCSIRAIGINPEEI